MQMNTEPEKNKYLKRRDFLGKSILLTTGIGIVGLSVIPGCVEKKDEEDEEGQKVSPPEDLMQEHGLLNRILLIYDACKLHLSAKENFRVTALADAAGIIRTFVEDYHEKQEEQYIFPRFQKANQQVDLVQTLLQQHDAGRNITSRIIQVTKSQKLSASDNETLLRLLTDFNTMYRPHEAREDTVLFPSFRKIVSKHEYDSLGEEFEKNEQKLFGKDGFESMIEKVAAIEKSLNIYELNQFTPHTK
jgi:hemerythrin-like domain-containing protein